ncbi:hypothetical protein, partial [Neisseria iguanae]|uniref:hypothetical protein n=1 Tax=Neisseria iguanae TaxID=90242 RepID=UPI001472B6A3
FWATNAAAACLAVSVIFRAVAFAFSASLCFCTCRQQYVPLAVPAAEGGFVAAYGLCGLVAVAWKGSIFALRSVVCG